MTPLPFLQHHPRPSRRNRLSCFHREQSSPRDPTLACQTYERPADSLSFQLRKLVQAYSFKKQQLQTMVHKASRIAAIRIVNGAQHYSWHPTPLLIPEQLQLRNVSEKFRNGKVQRSKEKHDSKMQEYIAISNNSRKNIWEIQRLFFPSRGILHILQSPPFICSFILIFF